LLIEVSKKEFITLLFEENVTTDLEVPIATNGGANLTLTSVEAWDDDLVPVSLAQVSIIN
jgi:hypothetical protein